MSQPLPLNKPETMELKVGAPLPSAELQRLWFALLKRHWSSLVVVPAEPGLSTVALGKALAEMGSLHRGTPVTFVSAEGMDVSGTSRLILEMTSHVNAGGVMVLALDSVLAQPAGIPVALAADAAVLCVELGRTESALAKQTVEAIGQDRFIGAVTLGLSAVTPSL